MLTNINGRLSLIDNPHIYIHTWHTHVHTHTHTQRPWHHSIIGWGAILLSVGASGYNANGKTGKID